MSSLIQRSHLHAYNNFVFSLPQTHSLAPPQFAAILIQKLESVKKEQEAQEKLDRKLLENDLEREDIAGSESGVVDTAVSSRALADALREKLMVEDDNDQAILGKVSF